jgi:hypothetical protein
MRDCIFLVADSQMEATFRGFLTREKFYLSLGTGFFEFDPALDIIRPVSDRKGDSIIHQEAHILLRTYQNTHRYAVIVLDKQWDGSPQIARIEQDVAGNMTASGWTADRFVVIVIDPELEAWVLQDSSMLQQIFKLDLGEVSSPKSWLVQKGLWDDAKPKADDPKAALITLLKQSTVQKVPASAANYQKITHAISVKSCIDPAFDKLRSTLQSWFPPKGVQR